MEKVSIRFYKDHEVRAVWSEEENKWFFSVLDVVGAINEQPDYAKTRNYWKYLKTKLRKEGNELVSATNQLKLRAADGRLCERLRVGELARNLRMRGKYAPKRHKRLSAPTNRIYIDNYEYLTYDGRPHRK